MSGSRTTRCAFVALVGAPNVGKSSLLNRLVGTKVSIVSPKPQTTRRRIMGITVRGDTQLCFVDTPGIFAAAGKLEKAMVEAAWRAAGDADLVVVVLDAKRGLDSKSRAVIEGLRGTGKPTLLAINKIDLVKPPALLPLTAEANALLPFVETFYLSAETGEGVEELLASLEARAPAGPWLFPEDQLSDLSNRAMAAEITREKIFLQLREEVPYATTVETEQWVESLDGKEIRIDQTIYVEKPGQKAIVIGKGGARLKAIGEAARADLEALLGARVHLFLFVKVREGWKEDPERWRELGLEPPGRSR
ncbi:MAG: GTPase Era [Geminicoccaceae bacterium]|nr:GTPase Era [Geminicoccaceae bacterium]